MKWLWPGSTVTRVVDGDSFHARVTRDLGFHGTATFEQKMRLARIDAAPVSTASGLSARVFLEELVAGKTLSIETVGPYKYGDEWMAEVTLDDGRNVADELVSAGLAVPWDGRGPRPGQAQ